MLLPGCPVLPEQLGYRAVVAAGHSARPIWPHSTAPVKYLVYLYGSPYQHSEEYTSRYTSAMSVQKWQFAPSQRTDTGSSHWGIDSSRSRLVRTSATIRSSSSTRSPSRTASSRWASLIHEVHVHVSSTFAEKCDVRDIDRTAIAYGDPSYGGMTHLPLQRTETTVLAQVSPVGIVLCPNC